MKLSVEAKVAASVAAAFVALTVGVIAQGNTDQSVGPNGYGTTEKPGVRTDMSQHGYDKLLSGHTNADEERYRTL